MAAGPQISQQKILAASQGDQSAMLEVLQSIGHVSVQQQTVTGTTPTGTTAGKVNKNAPVPPQATGSVSLLNKSLIVEIVNPGATSPISQLQAAQAAQNATPASAVQPVKSIYHQIRVSTSPAFNVNSNTQVFGGNTGAAQTYWTLTGLGTGNWFVQFRSTYDGINFNTWKNADRGSSGSVSSITVQSETNSVWATFNLPGNELVSVGAGFTADQGSFGVPQGLYSSAMMALASPNGFNTLPPQVSNIPLCNVTVPPANSGSVGVPDFLPVVNMKYGGRSYPQSTYSGNANIFAIAFDPTGNNCTVYNSPDGLSSWAVFTLPGGSKLGIGKGSGADGDSIFVPSQTPWITSSNMLSIVTVQGGNGTGRGMGGINAATLSGLTINASYRNYDSSDTWSGTGIWLAVAWMPGAITVTTQGGKWVVVSMGNGNHITFGSGVLASGSAFGFPMSYGQLQFLSFASPASFTGNHDNALHVISNCDVAGTTVQLAYIDGSGNSWNGNVNWFSFGWGTL